MITFVIACILLVVSVIALLGSSSKSAHEEGANNAIRIGGGVMLVVGIVMFVSSFVYSQGVGDVKVIKNIGGSVAGSSADAGFHVKAPWQSTVTYDIRNNVVSFIGDGQDSFDGGSAYSKQVTVADKGGATADVDVQVNYSVKSSAAIDIYKDYGSQENFVKSIVAIDTRSVTRDEAGKFETIELLTNRGKFSNAIQDALASKWKKYGLQVEQVSVQDIRYGNDIKNKYNEAQAAEIDVQKAENEQRVAKTEAETKKIKAQGDADANYVLERSLTDNVLKQKYIDALKNAKNLTVVPDGSVPMVNAN